MASDNSAYGLNKAARLRAEREAKRLADEPPPLESDFPYDVLAFDPLFFGVRDEWPPDAN